MKKRKKPKSWGRTQRQRDLNAEKSFLDAWADKKFFPSWIIEIRGATSFEDHIEKKDAVIISKDIQYGIQIKSQNPSVDMFNELVMRNVIPLCITPFDTEEEIRRNTLNALSIFCRRKGLEDPTKDSNHRQII